MHIELRIYKVNCHNATADTFVEGVEAYFKSQGKKYKKVEFVSRQLNRMIDVHTGILGLNAQPLLDELNKEKLDIANGLLQDYPHWDLIFVGSKIRGGFAVGQGPRGTDKSFHIIATTYLGSHSDVKAFILGLHEAWHVHNSAHCLNSSCIFSVGDFSGRKLDWYVIKFYESGGNTVPLCPKHEKMLFG